MKKTKYSSGHKISKGQMATIIFELSSTTMKSFAIRKSANRIISDRKGQKNRFRKKILERKRGAS